MSCVSASSCTAVGYSGDNTLVESWNGSAWSVVRSPDRGTNSTLEAVSCVSAGMCEAVGNYTNRGLSRSLVESWNGSAWSVVRSPDRGTNSTLEAVSCVAAASCEAVGNYSSSSLSQALVESWNGTAWSVVVSPRLVPKQSALNGVYCVSGQSCVAVGNYGSRTLIESWNGTAWSAVTSPTPGNYGGLSGVSCTSARSCVAVGDYSNGTGSAASILPRTLVESWNGAAWSVVPGPSPSVAYLYGVSCASARSCKAVGDYASSIGVFSDAGRVLERHRVVARAGPESLCGPSLRRVLCFGEAVQGRWRVHRRKRRRPGSGRVLGRYRLVDLSSAGPEHRAELTRG